MRSVETSEVTENALRLRRMKVERKNPKAEENTHARSITTIANGKLQVIRWRYPKRQINTTSEGVTKVNSPRLRPSI